MRTLCVCALLVLVVGCRKESAENTSDSLLTQPGANMQPSSKGVYVDSEKNLIIDSSRMRPPEHQQALERFSAMQVRDTYHDYQPIRKPTITEAQRTEFLTKHKITLVELKAILEEGDRLGWSQTK